MSTVHHSHHSHQIHHHSHRCPLVHHEHGNFTCDGCGRHGHGSRYRCHNCNFDLHHSCAKYSFPCHGHPLTYQPCVQPCVVIICDCCNTRICGAHYSCRGCDFQVHPNCVQCPPPTWQPCGQCPVYSKNCNRCNHGRRC